jgi:hypothetical protein
LHCAERCANLHQAAASGIKRLVKRSATGDPFGATRFVCGILLPRLIQALLSAGKLGGNRFLFCVPVSALMIQIAQCTLLILDLVRQRCESFLTNRQRALHRPGAGVQGAALRMERSNSVADGTDALPEMEKIG